MTPEDIIAELALQPHPEGGYFRETFRDCGDVARAHSTAIYYLLKDGQRSHWHRVDAAEVWHWYAGSPLELSIEIRDGEVRRHVLGQDLANGARPQCVVPPLHWQSARSFGVWTLVGCTVAPGFEFSGFEMAPPGWEPKGVSQP